MGRQNNPVVAVRAFMSLTAEQARKPLPVATDWSNLSFLLHRMSSSSGISRCTPTITQLVLL